MTGSTSQEVDGKFNSYYPHKPFPSFDSTMGSTAPAEVFRADAQRGQYLIEVVVLRRLLPKLKTFLQKSARGFERKERGGGYQPLPVRKLGH